MRQKVCFYANSLWQHKRYYVPAAAATTGFTSYYYLYCKPISCFAVGQPWAYSKKIAAAALSKLGFLTTVSCQGQEEVPQAVRNFCNILIETLRVKNKEIDKKPLDKCLEEMIAAITKDLNEFEQQLRSKVLAEKLKNDLIKLKEKAQTGDYWIKDTMVFSIISTFASYRSYLPADVRQKLDKLSALDIRNNLSYRLELVKISK